jgi:hypothetical protein
MPRLPSRETVVGSLMTFSRAAIKVFDTSAGTPAGAKNADQTPNKFCL